MKKEKKIQNARPSLAKRASTTLLMGLIAAGGLTLTSGTAQAATESVQAVSGGTQVESRFFDRFRCQISGGRFINGRCFRFRHNFDRDRFDRDRNRHRGPDRDRFDRDWDRDYGHGRNDDNDRRDRDGNRGDRDGRGDNNGRGGNDGRGR